MTVPLIEFRDVTKRFGAKTVLDRVNLVVYEGEITSIIGKSGVGKSVLLKHIIGLINPDDGDIFFRGTPIRTMKRSQRKDLKHQVSYMFQNNALFDSLTVFENIALPLREKTRLHNTEIEERVRKKIDQMELSEVGHKYPSQISGGMQKRVALARALITGPSIVLFDEPTSGLDPLRKNAVLGMIAHNQKKFGFTAVLVSHDIPDVFFISNRVAIIEEGRILFQGTPLELEQDGHPVIQEFIRGLDNLKDELTGLSTRQNLENRLRREMGRVERFQETFCIVLFTVQSLEQISEHVGYIAAQRVVQALGAMLKEHFGTSGISARYSRNEILTVLPHTGTRDARRMLAALAGQLKQAEIFQTRSYPSACFAFSILAGVAEARAGTTLADLIGEATAQQETIFHLDCHRRGEAA